MTPDHCAQTTPAGRPCHHLASRCPFHPAPVPETQSETEPPNPHVYIYNALQAVVEGRASPAVVDRLVKTLVVADRLGPPPVARDQMHAEIALRGMTMHGIPPRTEDQWLLARDLFTPGALHMFAGWVKSFDPPPPEWLKDIPNPDDDLFPPISKATYDAYTHYEQPDFPRTVEDVLRRDRGLEPHAALDPEEPPLWED